MMVSQHSEKILTLACYKVKCQNRDFLTVIPSFLVSYFLLTPNSKFIFTSLFSFLVIAYGYAMSVV